MVKLWQEMQMIYFCEDIKTMLSSFIGGEVNLRHTENKIKKPKQENVFGNKVRNLVPHNQSAV